MAVLHTYRYSLACRHLGPSVDGCVVQADGDFRKAGVLGRHGSDYLVGSDAVSADGCHLLCGSGARGLAGSAIILATVLPPGGHPAIGVSEGTGDCGFAVRRRVAVSLSQDRQDESGRVAEE